ANLNSEPSLTFTGSVPEQLSTSNVVLGASPSSGHRAIFIVANVRGSSTAIETVYQEGEDGDLLTRINQIDATNNASKEM
ncbi:hypothetical protein R0K05_24625, partial [Planococcus sp. SIMBA_160]